ncbi:hypothetical protein Fmac_002296 [Flemingia macrophylla]|uniref:BSD domain-containing protein n=1 Tax=Flemingia macrophylla TaxID=520843 RepID=A0ABD1NJI1_9FABA
MEAYSSSYPVSKSHSLLHSVRKPQAKPWKKAATPIRVYKVDAINFRDLVQQLTGAPHQVQVQPLLSRNCYQSQALLVKSEESGGGAKGLLELNLSSPSPSPVKRCRREWSYRVRERLFHLGGSDDRNLVRGCNRRSMSWFARTIANSLRLDDEDDDNDNGGNLKSPPNKPDSEPVQPDSAASTPSPTARGVKEDFSELTKSFSRQLWGVASFLAPPPDRQPESPAASDPNPADDEDVIAGIRNDFAEISGKFKSGISKISGNKTVSEFTKIASSFLQIGSEEDYDLDGVVGVTEDVVAFARSVALHPETWLDFPLPDDPDSDDFDLSDAQHEHALAVEHLAPSLAALRMELCPGYMSDGSFWKIYFVLLHPRLSKSDANILSTPQIMEARAMLTHALDKRSKEKKETDLSVGDSIPFKEEEQHLFVPVNAQPGSASIQTSIAVTDVVEATPSVAVSDGKMEKHPTQSAVTQIIDKSVVKDAPVNPTAEQSSSGPTDRSLDDEDDADDWLKEDTSEMVGPSGTSVQTGNDEDVSFSDLEDDDGDIHASYKKTRSGSDSSTKDSRDWVQLSRSSPNSDKDINSVENKQAGSEHSSARNSVTKDSNDWLNVDDIDVM